MGRYRFEGVDMSSGQEWDIKKRSDACSKSESPFADGQQIVSRLFFDEEGYVRDDFASDIWTDEMGVGAISVWRGIFRMPPPPPEEPLKKETAESLLRDLIKKEDYTQKNAIYILAVMLERRRILAEKEVMQQEEHGKVRVYEHRKTGETFVIPDPELKLAELEEVQREVLELLGVEGQRSQVEGP